MNKGAEIYRKTGKYGGMTGWIDGDKRETAQMVYVIIDYGESRYRTTRLRKESVGNHRATPKTYEQAAFQQHRDVEQLMNQLARKLAQLNVNTEVTCKMFEETLNKAKKHQQQKKHKALWKNVEFKVASAKRTENPNSNHMQIST